MRRHTLINLRFMAGHQRLFPFSAGKLQKKKSKKKSSIYPYCDIVHVTCISGSYLVVKKKKVGEGCRET